METPEKIYRTTTYLDNNIGKTVWKVTPVKGAENIEYIRKDVFIEKAAKWINEHTNLSEKLVIDDFKKYMEG